MLIHLYIYIFKEIRIIFNRVNKFFRLFNNGRFTLYLSYNTFRCYYIAPVIVNPSINLIMDALIDLHHDIIAFSVFILIFLMYRLLLLLDEFTIKKNNKLVSREYKFNTSLITILGAVSLFISLVFIVVCLSDIVLFVEDIPSSSVTVKFKIIDHQLYWTYENLSIKNQYELQNTYILRLPDQSILLKEGFFFKKYNLISIDRPLTLPAYSTIQFIVVPDDILFSISVPAFNIEVEIYPERLNYIELNTGGRGVFYGQYSLETCIICNKRVFFIINIIDYTEFKILIMCEINGLWEYNLLQKLANKQNKKISYFLNPFKSGIKNSFYNNHCVFDSSHSHFISRDSFLSPNFRPKGLKTPFQYYFPYHATDPFDSSSELITENSLFIVSRPEQITRLDQFMLDIQPQYREEFKNNQYGVKPDVLVSWLEETRKKLIIMSENSNIELQNTVDEKKQIKFN